MNAILPEVKKDILNIVGDNKTEEFCGCHFADISQNSMTKHIKAAIDKLSIGDSIIVFADF